VQYLGFVLVFLAVVALLVGLMQHLKGKKILAAPFKKTGEIAANPAVADAKGIVSCEGAIEAQQPAIAPCSGKPCVYFEIEVIQEWSKHVVTEDGHKTETGKDTIQTVKTGAVFFVNDGSGPVAIDPREGMNVELDESFKQTQNVSHGDVMFGQFHTHVGHASGDKHGTGVKVIEKIVPVQGGMFVMGQLANQAITKPKGMLGSLMASRKGRNALLGATKRNKIIGFVAGGLFFVPGLGMSIFMDAPTPTAAGEGSCNILDQSKPNEPCTGKIRDDDGYNVELTVTQGETVEIQGGPPRGKKIPVIASISVKGPDGKSLLTDAHETGTVDLQPGKYTVNIKDSIPGDAAHFKGGFSFELLVKRTALLAAADAGPEAGAAAPSASVAAVPGKPATKAAGSGVKPGAAVPAKSGAAAPAKSAGKK
jgi:E3 Ubiquitin ligase